jgi:cyanophycinase
VVKLVFLIGGDVAYEAMADAFLAAAGGTSARIALLLQGGERWAQYLPNYTEPWTRRGITDYQPVIPEADGALNVDRTQEILQQATGIFIGGGHTPTYHRLYAAGPTGKLIRERYEQGIPIAGVSAGALLACEDCVFSVDEQPDKTLHIVSGLSLVRDLVLGVHFTARNALPEMLEVMAQTRTKTGLGLDDAACAVFENGRFMGVLGQGVYEIAMEDFEKRLYRVTECTVAYSGPNVA